MPDEFRRDLHGDCNLSSYQAAHEGHSCRTFLCHSVADTCNIFILVVNIAPPFQDKKISLNTSEQQRVFLRDKMSDVRAPLLMFLRR